MPWFWMFAVCHSNATEYCNPKNKCNMLDCCDLIRPRERGHRRTVQLFTVKALIIEGSVFQTESILWETDWNTERDSQLWAISIARLESASSACQISTRSGPSSSSACKTDNSCRDDGKLLTWKHTARAQEQREISTDLKISSDHHRVNLYCCVLKYTVMAKMIRTERDQHRSEEQQWPP